MPMILKIIVTLILKVIATSCPSKDVLSKFMIYEVGLSRDEAVNKLKNTAKAS